MKKYIKNVLMSRVLGASFFIKCLSFSVITLGLLLGAKSVEAAVLTNGILGEDELSRPQVTFQTDNWRDMMDTYLSPQLHLAATAEGQEVTTIANFATDNHGTLRFEVTGTVLGNSVWAQIMGNQAAGGSVNQDTIREGRSLYIDGNGHTLYFDNNTTPTNGIGGRGDANSSAAGTVLGPRRGWFAGVQGRTANTVTGQVGTPAFSNDNTVITPQTRMTLDNAILINSITGGIFQARVVMCSLLLLIRMSDIAMVEGLLMRHLSMRIMRKCISLVRTLSVCGSRAREILQVPIIMVNL